MKKLIILYIFLETLVGFGLGIAFIYILPFSGKGHLEQSMINTFMTVFLGVIIGIAIPGYFHCKKISKLNRFFKAVGFSIVGLILFLILYILQNFLTFDYLPHYVSSMVLPVILPILGAVLGFNYALKNKLIKQS